MIHFVSVDETTEEVLYGTCELCEYLGSLTYETWIFEDTKTGERHRYQNGGWNWGEFEYDFYITNLVHFGDWFNNSPYCHRKWREIEMWLPEIVSEYTKTLERGEEEDDE